MGLFYISITDVKPRKKEQKVLFCPVPKFLFFKPLIFKAHANIWFILL